MRRMFLGLATFGLLVGGTGQAGLAQQTPRRSVTYVFKQAPVAKAQFSPDAAGSNATSSITSGSNSVAPASSAGPAALPAPVQGSNLGQTSNSANSNATPGDDPVLSGNGGQRPNVQQMQNPSGIYNFSPAISSPGQYVSGNNYLGSQFNNWNNLRLQPTTLDQFQAFNRTQPPAPVPGGAYLSPNNYFGPAFGQWNNLSSGTITPNYLGGYSYQP